MKLTHISRAQSLDAAANSPYKVNVKEFEGDVTLQRLVRTEDSKEIELLGVWFSAGGRTRPHIHDVDQVLHIVEGQGVVADEHETLLVKAGDVVTVQGGVWHWHGATPHSAMMHISIRKQGNSTNWEVEDKNWRTVYEELREQEKQGK
jgi:quercetin dioxygenase-like cupin family protein